MKLNQQFIRFFVISNLNFSKKKTTDFHFWIQFEQKLSKQKLYFQSLKQQLINFYERLGKDHQLISSIHDENVDVSTIKRVKMFIDMFERRDKEERVAFSLKKKFDIVKKNE